MAEIKEMAEQELHRYPATATPATLSTQPHYLPPTPQIATKCYPTTPQWLRGFKADNILI